MGKGGLMENEKVILLGRPITCSKCGQGGGTLIRIDKDTYRHQECPPKRRPPMIITDGRVK